MTNDRWGQGTACKHGGFYNCQDKYTPGQLPKHKWEKCTSVDTLSWGYRRNMKLKELMDLPSIIDVKIQDDVQIAEDAAAASSSGLNASRFLHRIWSAQWLLEVIIFSM